MRCKSLEGVVLKIGSIARIYLKEVKKATKLVQRLQYQVKGGKLRIGENNDSDKDVVSLRTLKGNSRTDGQAHKVAISSGDSMIFCP